MLAGSLLIGILFCTAQGLDILKLFNYYGMGLAPICLVLAQVIVICWLSDFSKLEHFFMFSSSPTVHKLIRIYLKFVLPILIALGILITFISDCINPIKLAASHQVIGWILFLIPLFALFFSLLITKKTFLCCVSKQIAEGHMITLESEEQN